MSEVSAGGVARLAPLPVGGAADWLCLAAAPTFAIMALLTSVLGGVPSGLCAAAPDGALLSGMVPMYLLMSAFHAAPWLRLIQTHERRPTHE